MARIDPFVYFNGNAKEAFTFYKSVFGGEFARISYYGDLADQFPVAENDKNRIMYIILPVGNSGLLMGSDTLEIMGPVPENDNRHSISITAESRTEADRLFQSLSEGGSVEMPISDGPTGAYFGMVADRFGVKWMVNFEESNL